MIRAALIILGAIIASILIAEKIPEQYIPIACWAIFLLVTLGVSSGERKDDETDRCS